MTADKIKESLDSLERLKTAPSFMGGTYEYQACTQSEALLIQDYKIVKQSLLKAQEQEKENELLKEIIRSLFDRGCPLHQYIDEDFGLTIEVDSECSIMRLGEFKGVDLDAKLKEVLEWAKQKIW